VRPRVCGGENVCPSGTLPLGQLRCCALLVNELLAPGRHSERQPIQQHHRGGRDRSRLEAFEQGEHRSARKEDRLEQSGTDKNGAAGERDETETAMHLRLRTKATSRILGRPRCSFKDLEGTGTRGAATSLAGDDNSSVAVSDWPSASWQGAV
jgi:hypothetical protein